MLQKALKFEYVHLWQSELSYLRAVTVYQYFSAQVKRIREVQPENFLSIFALEITKFKTLMQDFQATAELKLAEKR
jgi:hypothetical protein